MRRAFRPFLIASLAALGLSAGAVTAKAESPIVVELYTSQGCSSCPPADALLGELARRDDLLPLAFHVDYWDRLGWKDPFSMAAATERQRDYARTFFSRTVYTPQMVIGGMHSVVGSDRSAVTKAIQDTPPSPVMLDLAVADGKIAARIGAAEVPANGQKATLWLIGFDARHDTQVLRGENAGRKLTNVNIVRSLQALATWDGRAQMIAHDRPALGDGVALLLQAPNGRILAAAAHHPR